jgi:pimeloyl-ACP methyl ester carboxylesterase
MTAKNLTGATVVLVHAAWADASSWNKIIMTFQRKGMEVVAVQIPLTSLSDDVAAVRRALERLSGPVVLAGHSYGGAVITAAGNDPKVKALVYVAGIAPAGGETVGTLFHRVAPHPGAPQLSPDSDGLLWLPPDAFADAVAPDASPEETSVMQSTQKPIALRCLGEPLTHAAWKDKPSWFIIAEKDRMISPDTQRFMAERMGSRIYSLPVDHTPLASAPQEVVRVIAEAVDAALRASSPDPLRTGEQA